MAQFLNPVERVERYRREVKRQGLEFQAVAAALNPPRRSDEVLNTLRCADPRLYNLRAIARVLGKRDDWLILK